MDFQQGIFAVKLYELERNYAQFQSRIRLSQTAGHDQIRQEKETMERELEENRLILKNQLRASRSPVAADLAKMEEDYCEKSSAILNRIQDTNASGANSRADLSALYAEYTIDIAVQAMRHALLAVYTAIDAQLSEEET